MCLVVMNMMRTRKVKGTGEWIRDYLLQVGKAYTYDMWKAYRDDMRKYRVKTATYQSFRVYVSRLKYMGLIEPLTTQKRNPFQITYYRIVPGMEDSTLWNEIHKT